MNDDSAKSIRYGVLQGSQKVRMLQLTATGASSDGSPIHDPRA
jgi:hypothetical protein